MVGTGGHEIENDPGRCRCDEKLTSHKKVA
jgi:hypothetical protein